MWTIHEERVYPRVYGGTLVLRKQMRLVLGLSPRVRGNQVVEGRARRYKRSIPACTGEPRARRKPPRSPPVYPRVYGGTPGLVLGEGGRNGLSPRVRGNHARLPGHAAG